MALSKTEKRWAAALSILFVLLVIYLGYRAGYYDKWLPRWLGPAGAKARFEPGLGRPGAGQNYYRPACGGTRAYENRGRCRGETSGKMPSIEEDMPVSWRPCCGHMGVPPPTWR